MLWSYVKTNYKKIRFSKVFFIAGSWATSKASNMWNIKDLNDFRCIIFPYSTLTIGFLRLLNFQVKYISSSWVTLESMAKEHNYLMGSKNRLMLLTSSTYPDNNVSSSLDSQLSELLSHWSNNRPWKGFCPHYSIESKI